MDRRAFLASLAALGSGCAGGSGGETPAGTPTAVPRRTGNGDSVLQTGELPGLLESSESFVERVTYVAVADGRLHVRYESGAGDSNKLGDTEFNERVYVGGGYANWEEDHNGVPLRATVIDAFDDPQYYWRMEPEWAERLRNEQVSYEELGRKIAETITTPTASRLSASRGI